MSTSTIAMVPTTNPAMPPAEKLLLPSLDVFAGEVVALLVDEVIMPDEDEIEDEDEVEDEDEEDEEVEDEDDEDEDVVAAKMLELKLQRT